MEPRQSGPSPSYEQVPMRPLTGEAYGLTGNTEQGGVIERANERERPALSEHESKPPMVPVVPVPLPQVDGTVPGDDVASAALAAPAVAADEDLIEKEWVDKAKKIIEDTRDDPYRREQEIGGLQREYIRKRYGREIGEAGG